MRVFTWLFSCVLLVSASAAELRFDFGEYEYGTTPTNFESVVAGGPPGDWKIISADMPSAFASLSSNAPVLIHSKVLAQTSTDMTDERFPMCIYDGDIFRNFEFSAKFKIVSGITEQMAGLVFRYQNSSNFYVVRVSAAGHNVRFYKVVNGERSDPIGPMLDVPVGEWHRLGVQCEGNQINVFLDNKPVMPTLGDNTFTEGRLGFWTKSDSVTYFDDADVIYTPRIPLAQQMVDAVAAKESRLLGLRVFIADTNNATHIVASMNKTEIGQPGTDAEIKAIQNGTISYGRLHGINHLTMPLRDRNGDNIGAVRIISKAYFAETQSSALERATMIRNMLEEYCPNGDELKQ